MKTSWLVLSVLALFGTSAFAAPGDPPNTRVTYPTSVFAELLGRGLLYTVGLEQVVSEDLAVGVGFSSAKTERNGVDGVTAKLIPVYMNYYFKKQGSSPFVTAGADVVLNSSDVRGNTSNVGNLRMPSDAILPTAGIGFESRTDQGFLFRVAAYALVGDIVKPWLGFTFGHGF